MIEIGYWLSSEEHSPNELVRYAEQAENVGFSFAVISDHYHPWLDRQGHSPFVWSVIGGIAYATQRLRLGTGVTCPLIRIHPAIVAQAAATAATMMPGRFFLGVGTGENLNEHILGQRWPPARVRLEMLEEAVEVIRLLWQGGLKSHRGNYFTVENARIYTLPEELPPIMVAASGPRATELAGRIGDGLISVAPSSEVVESFRGAGGADKPCYGQFKVCWAATMEQARRIAHQWWPMEALKGSAPSELSLPSHFSQVTELVSEDDVAEAIVCGPDPEAHIEKFRLFADAGYDHVCVHQVGPDQEGFLRFYEQEVFPEIEKMGL